MIRYIIILYLFTAFTVAADVDLKSLNDAIGEDNQIHAWIMFKDKGSDFVARKQNITLHPKTLERRKKLFLEPVTWYDVPVFKEYINGIILVGAEIHRKSKWLNAVSVFASLSQIKTIAAMNLLKAFNL